MESTNNILQKFALIFYVLIYRYLLPLWLFFPLRFNVFAVNFFNHKEHQVYTKAHKK